MDYFQSLRDTFRGLVRRRAFTLMALVTLALAIGANVTIYSLLDAFLIRPLPYENPEKLAQVWATDRNVGTSKSRVSLPTFLDWAESSESFESISAHFYRTYVLSGGERPEKVMAGRVSTNLLTTLGVPPMLGSGLPDPSLTGEERVVLLSHGLWRRAFGGDPGIIGRAVRLDHEPYEVVGVMPPEFEFPMKRVELWLPMSADEAKFHRERHMFEVVGRLQDGISLAEAQEELKGISANLARAYEEEEGRGVNVVPLRHALIFYFDLVRLMLFAIAAMGGLLLFVACLNVGAGIVAMTVQRSREFGIRMALGANRSSVLRQLLLEAGCLAALGAVGGAFLGSWGSGILEGWIPQDLYRVGEIGIDASALGFSVCVAFLATLFLGLLPGRQILKLQLQQALRENEGSGGGRYQHRLRSSLVVGQIAVGVGLLIGAGLMVRSLVELQRAEPGFDSESLLTVQMSIPEASYPELREAHGFYKELLAKVRSVPMVEEAAVAVLLPLNFETDVVEIAAGGLPEADEDQRPVVVENRVSPGFFQALGVPLLRGRPFRESDDLDSPRVVAVNRALAERLWGRVDVVGERLHLYGPWEADVEIVGVVADLHHKSLQEPVAPQLYRPVFQSPHRAMSLLVRSRSAPGTAVAPVREAIWGVDARIPLEFIPYNDILAQALSLPAILASLLSIFGLIALVLATVGTYGLIWSSVAERRREMGVRMALGAEGADVLRLILSRGLRLTVIGLLIGLPGGFVVARALGSFLVGVESSDPWTFGGIALFVALAATAASYIPARRATRVDPLEALRFE